MSKTYLLTGGAGYIGSHTAVEIAQLGHRVVIVDNLSNSSQIAVERIRALAPDAQIDFVELDILDEAGLDRLFAEHSIDAVVHFAGLKAVGESVADPLRYYRNNVAGTVVLLEVMQRHGVRNLVFSSSATVYGEPSTVPINEEFPLGAVNPYGQTKLVIEAILGDVAASEPGWHIASLRYFNPAGAHASGTIGEDPAGIPNNLMPYVMQVATGRLAKVRVFGDDYPTPDGTGVRDYIHVVDLAQGHLAALDRLDSIEGIVAVNLGTGQGCSVLQLIEAASRAVGRQLPYEIVDRRPGDAAAVWADPTMAREVLGWEAKLTLEQMCEDSWRWQSQNPNGYNV